LFPGNKQSIEFIDESDGIHQVSDAQQKAGAGCLNPERTQHE
jgi:hypothetical protein